MSSSFPGPHGEPQHGVPPVVDPLVQAVLDYVEQLLLGSPPDPSDVALDGPEDVEEAD